MLANNNNFEEKLRKKFEGAEMAPPPDLWSKIDKQLQYVPPKKENDYRSFYLGAAAAFFICLLSAALYVMLASENKINGNSGEKTQLTEKIPTPKPYVEGVMPQDYKEETNKNQANVLTEKTSSPYNNVQAKEQHNASVSDNAYMASPEKEANQNITHNITPPPSINTAFPLPSEEKKVQNSVVTVNKSENEGEKGVNSSVLAIKEYLNTKDSPFTPHKKATFAEQLNEIEPISFHTNVNLVKNANISVISPKLEMPLAAKSSKISGYVNVGAGKVYYGSPNDNARYAWNRLGIGTASAISDSFDVFTLETPRDINNLSSQNVANVQLSILNYDEYVGGGIEYKINRIFGISSGLDLHHQRIKIVQLPLDYVQDYKPTILTRGIIGLRIKIIQVLPTF
jgi:hypothetical protein